MKIQCTPIDYDYFDFQGKNYAKIIGRDDKGKKVCLIDSCDVFLWAILKDNIGEKKVKEISEKIRKIKLSEKGRASEVIKTEIHNKKYLGKNVTAIKILITNHKDAHSFAEKIDFKEIDKRREFDLPYITRYILEKKLKPLQWYEIEGEILNNSPEFGGIDNKLDVNICLKVEKIKEIEKEIYQPKILSYDIETDEFDIGKGHIVMISLVGENFKKVITWKEKSNKEFVEHVKDESAMLEKCVEYIKDYNPDILVGYFSDGFDLPYLRARAEKNHIKFNIGADDSQPTFTRGRLTTGKIKGIVHIDLFRFIRVTYGQYLQSETLSLNEVALELLGEKKNNWIHKHSSKINGREWDTYYEYNLQDALLTYKLMQKLWPDFYEFTNVIQEPLFDISRDSLSTQVENYIIHHSGQYNEIIEKRPYNTDIEERRSEEKYEGAFVFQPIPGLYDNVVFFDFTSMYGSVIVTYNLSKSTYLEKKEKDSLKVEMGKETVYFSKEPGFFSLMLQEIIEKRKLFKKEYNENPNPILKARSNAFKLLANAAYGYQGFFGARYYCLKAAAATAALARKSIKETIEVIEKNNNKIIYSDTDSIAFLQGNKTEKDIMDLLKKINETLPGIMELDLEGFYKRGIWVSRRNGDIGAKKKYALIDINDKIKIRGFETVRRDWCNLARETQNKVLDLILKNGDEKKAVELVKEVIEKIKKRDIDLNKLIIKTQLKKSIEEYKSEGPHVTIAKKMREQGKPVNIGMLIEYY
ncbi:ribonuclease H-like domain-containing protein, partial [Candidatus Pacearchaeota archaeon]|nr:ribonuclease H-like domain-containing protein [Candidatus Pacearchaeota archaeon]